MSKKEHNKSYLKKNKIDLIFIIFISLFTSILVYFLINANNQLGIYCSDVFIYLTNSMNFAGYSISKSSNLYLSPVICFLTSIIFRLGFIDQLAIFIVTGIFFPIATIGLYLLFRLKLNNLISLFGTVLFASFSLNILWAANGSLDIPGIAISIWIIYFTILAIDKNPKYFLILFPLFIIGFFTRYTVGFILPLIFLYILFDIDIIQKIKSIFTKKEKHEKNSRYIESNHLRKRINNSLKKLIKSKRFKYFIIGIIISLILYSMVTVILTSKGSDLTFISQTQSAISGDKGSTIDPGFKPDPYFYIRNIPNFISSESVGFDELIPVLQNPTILSYFIILLILSGGIAYIFNSLNKNNKNSKINLYKLLNVKSQKGLLLKIFLIVTISILIIITYKHISSIISEILFLINILLIFNVFTVFNNLNTINVFTVSNSNNINTINNENNDSEKSQEKKIKGLNFNLLMISWFFIYLIFFSFSDVKVDRYFITILPVIAYFAAYSLEVIENYINPKFSINKNNILNKRKGKKKGKNKPLMMNISTVITVGLILIFIGSAFSNIGTIPTENKNISGPSEISEWLINYDPNYNTKVIWTHNIRYYTWYLKMNVYGAYEKDIPKLTKNNVSYFISKNISDENYTIENYTIIKKQNDIYIYKRNI